MPKKSQLITLLLASSAILLCVAMVLADEKRAPAPRFSSDQTGQIFFDKLSDAFSGDRPTLSSVRKSATTTTLAPSPGNLAGGASADSSGGNVWTTLISPESLEDEIKRVKLHYDGLITTPGAFNSGGYQDARLDLTILATMFAVISQHEGDVRWKSESPAARDILARTAFRCSAGSTQVYNEAKTRKNDLQDLISGSGISNPNSEPENDWSAIADRSPLMTYAEWLRDELKSATTSEQAVKDEPAKVKRYAELIALLGEVLVQEGMDEADDEDYAALSKAMTKAAIDVRRALEINDYSAVSKAVGAVVQSCDTCHNEYR